MLFFRCLAFFFAQFQQTNFFDIKTNKTKAGPELFQLENISRIILPLLRFKCEFNFIHFMFCLFHNLTTT